MQQIMLKIMLAAIMKDTKPLSRKEKKCEG